MQRGQTQRLGPPLPRPHNQGQGRVGLTPEKGCLRTTAFGNRRRPTSKHYLRDVPSESSSGACCHCCSAAQDEFCEDPARRQIRPPERNPVSVHRKMCGGRRGFRCRCHFRCCLHRVGRDRAASQRRLVCRSLLAARGMRPGAKRFRLSARATQERIFPSINLQRRMLIFVVRATVEQFCPDLRRGWPSALAATCSQERFMAAPQNAS